MLQSSTAQTQHPEIFEVSDILNRKLTKKEKRRLKKLQSCDYITPVNFGLKLNPIQPITDNQRTAFEAYYEGKNLALLGAAGTGKTFLAMYLSCDDIINDRSGKKKTIIFRSAVQTRNLGFLGGKLAEKIKVYEIPYMEICNELFSRGDAYDILKNKQMISFESTSFLRGLTFNDTNIIIDEAQNMTSHELHSLLTRVGKNCRLMACGDVAQVDLET